MLKTLRSPRRRRDSARAVQLAGQFLQDDAVNQRAFAGTGNACDAGHDAERDADVDVLEVVLRRAAHHQPVAVRPALRTAGISISFAAQILAGDGCLTAMISSAVPWR
jgi:hypothetical protein